MFDLQLVVFDLGNLAEWLSGLATLAAVIVALWLGLREYRTTYKVHAARGFIIIPKIGSQESISQESISAEAHYQYGPKIPLTSVYFKTPGNGKRLQHFPNFSCPLTFGLVGDPKAENILKDPPIMARVEFELTMLGKKENVDILFQSWITWLCPWMQPRRILVGFRDQHGNKHEARIDSSLADWFLDRYFS